MFTITGFFRSQSVANVVLLFRSQSVADCVHYYLLLLVTVSCKLCSLLVLPASFGHSQLPTVFTITCFFRSLLPSSLGHSQLATVFTITCFFRSQSVADCVHYYLILLATVSWRLCSLLPSSLSVTISYRLCSLL